MRASSSIFSPISTQQQEAEEIRKRDAASSSNSSAGRSFSSSPATTNKATTTVTERTHTFPALGFSPGTAHSPMSVFSQNFPLPTDHSSPTVFLSPQQISPSPFFQNLIPTPHQLQSSSVSQNLFGEQPIVNHSTLIPSSHQPPITLLGPENPSPCPFQTQTNFFVNQNYFNAGPSGSPRNFKSPARNHQVRKHSISPNIPKKKRKVVAPYELEREETRELTALFRLPEAPAGITLAICNEGNMLEEDFIPENETNFTEEMVADSKPPEVP
ncbi:unnamed protein product [Linum trigynum]|uniref:Uncharacterized protein n=1 Tax=Linum trigynum TaxID=586398 RepID=A0AAV2FFA8_9ROSI